MRLSSGYRGNLAMVMTGRRTGSAAAPGVAFPAEPMAAARGIGIMTEYLRVAEGSQKQGEPSHNDTSLTGPQTMTGAVGLHQG